MDALDVWRVKGSSEMSSVARRRKLSGASQAYFERILPLAFELWSTQFDI